MQQRITFKTKDGTLKEQTFDDFNEFADKIEELASEYYTGVDSQIEVQSIYGDIIKQENVTNGSSRETDTKAELLRESN